MTSSLPAKAGALGGKKRRWLPWLLGGLVALPILLALAGFLVLRSYDFDNLRQPLIQAVSQATGRQLSLGGPLKLEISWHPRLVVQEAALAQDPPAPGQPPLVQAARVEVVVELWPLLSRRVVVERLVLRGVRVVLLTELTGLPTPPAPAPAAPAAPAPVAPSSAPVPPPAAPAGQAGQAAPAAPPAPPAREGGGLDWLRLQKVEVREAALEWRRPGQEPLSLEDVSLDLAQDQAGGPIAFAAQGSLAGQALTLSGQVQAPQAPNAPWALKAQLSQAGLKAQVQGQIKDPLASRGLDFQVGLEVAEPARLGLASLAGLPGPWRLAGRLSDPGPGSYRLDGLELASPAGGLAGWAQADFSGPRPQIKADLSAQALDLGALAGLAQAVQAPAPPAKAGAAGAGGQGAPGPGAASKTPAARPGKVFPADPLPLEALGALDLDLALKAGQLHAPKFDLDSVDLRLRLAGGALSLEPLQARLAGGPLELRLGLKPQGGQAQAHLALQLSGSQLAQVLRRAGQEELLDGLLALRLDLRGQGRSLAAIMAHLNGKTVAHVQGGSLKVRHLGILGSDLAGGILSALGEAVNQQQDNPLRCLVLGLVAQDGLAHTTALLLDSQDLVMVGRGDVNLRTEQLDLALRPLTKSGLTAPGGVGLGLGQPLQFKITGSLAQPSVSLDQAQALATLGKSLGGMAVLGPLGLAAGLASGGEGGSSLCHDALAAADQGVVYEPKGGVSRTLEKLGQGVQDNLRRLFGK